MSHKYTASLIDSLSIHLYHVLHNSMPNETVSSYALRPYNRELVNKTSRLVESSFIVRMLYKDIY